MSVSCTVPIHPVPGSGLLTSSPQANLAASAFVKSALPIHVNLTHTPPVLTDDAETKTVASADPGYIGHTALQPATFATGSYGWKGNKRFTVEVANPEGGEKEKVHVILTCVSLLSGIWRPLSLGPDG